jgi:hypothetical protein
VPLPPNCLKRLTAAGLPSPSCRRWSRNKSRISNNAKHDGDAAHSDTRSIQGQLVHCRNGRSSFRNVKDVWVVWWTFVSVTFSFRSAYRREVKKIWQIDFLRDQPQRASAASSHDIFYPSHNIFYRLGVRRRNDFKRAIASRAAPKVTYLPIVTIFRPFGRNQLIVASNAICPETRTTFGRYLSHGYSLAVASM